MRDQPRNHRACRFLLFQEINPRSDHSYEKSFTHRGKSFTLIQLKRNHDHAPSFLSPESISRDIPRNQVRTPWNPPDFLHICPIHFYVGFFKGG